NRRNLRIRGKISGEQNLAPLLPNKDSCAERAPGATDGRVGRLGPNTNSGPKLPTSKSPLLDKDGIRYRRVDYDVEGTIRKMHGISELAASFRDGLRDGTALPFPSESMRAKDMANVFRQAPSGSGPLEDWRSADRRARNSTE